MTRPALMRSFRWTSGSTNAARHTLFAMWLAIALLWAQWAGLAHRVEHGAGVGVVASRAAAEGGQPAPSTRHSCVVFDGLCLASSLPAAPMTLVVPSLALPLPASTPHASWHALFVSHFLSRAPPAA